MNVPHFFDTIATHYVPGRIGGERTYYFTVGDAKYTMRVTASECVVTSGKTVDRADCVLKTTPELFEKMVLRGKLPGPLDVAMGRVKTNDPLALRQLRQLFDFSAYGA